MKSDDSLPSGLRFLEGGGAATALILARDWHDHPLGTPETWPVTLKTALSLVLNSPESMILCWGREPLWFFFNETYFPLLGPRLDWAMGARFDKVWEDGLDQAMPIVEDAFAGNSPRFVDLPWKLATDRGAADTWWSFSYSRILDADGEIAGLFIFTNETTERVLADRTLAAAQQELLALNDTLERRVEERTAERDRMWNTSPDLMVEASLEGVYRRANPAWKTLLGFDEDEVIGRSAEYFTHPDDLIAMRDALATAQADALPNIDLRFRQKDGDYRWIQWVAAPSADSIFAIGRDVNAAIEAETLLRRTEEQLRQAQKMEAVGQLTGGLAHDFNNLLAGISGSLELMNIRIRQGRLAEVEKYMVAAQGATRRAAALTHRLLAFSRRQTLAPVATNVNALVSGMLDLVQRTVGPAVQVENVGAAGLWGALVDPSQLENALLNLCINARDAMPDGGRITIETGNRWIDRKMAQQLDMPEGQYLSLCVSDTGVGMSKDIIDKAFDPFFTTKPIGQGTGLGLSMIYGFAKQSGGQVRIYSELGAGTMVCIYLPRHTRASESAEATPQPLEPLRAEAGETVLVVDDEPTVRMLVADVLEELGYTAIEAGDGAAGLKLLQSDIRIDLLVTDVGLPGGMNGRQMADAARGHRPDLKVLFITGYAENALLNNGQLEPGMAVLTKPFAVDVLSARIREMITN